MNLEDFISKEERIKSAIENRLTQSIIILRSLLEDRGRIEYIVSEVLRNTNDFSKEIVFLSPLDKSLKSFEKEILLQAFRDYIKERDDDVEKNLVKLYIIKGVETTIYNKFRYPMSNFEFWEKLPRLDKPVGIEIDTGETKKVQEEFFLICETTQELSEKIDNLVKKRNEYVDIEYKVFEIEGLEKVYNEDV